MAKQQQQEELIKVPIQGYDITRSDEHYPRISVVVPVYNCAQIIDITLESVLSQNYPDFEVIVIDGGSTDRTLEVVRSHRTEQIATYSVSGFNRYEMINKGISQATGRYLNFLFPGDFYLTEEVFRIMMELVLSHDAPHLVFCGALLRDGREEAKILYRDLSLKLLRKGQQPTTLQSCWLRVDLFHDLGKFNTLLKLRGGYDLLCRYCLNKSYRTMSTYRVLTDYSLSHVTRRMVMTHFLETIQILTKYFGLFYALRWLCYQKDVARFFKLWWHALRLAFISRKV